MSAKVATPSWYDVLDVAPDATEAEIRAAWRSAIADLDPSDRRFRVLNQAAEVLLDRKGRETYDAGLAPAEPIAEPDAATDAATDEEALPSEPAATTHRS